MTDEALATAGGDTGVTDAAANAAAAQETPNVEVKLGTDGAAPAAETPAAITAEGADGEPAVVTYEPTGDVGLDVALTFIGGLGLGPDHPAMAAAMKGDFALLSATLATMGDKARGWEQMVALGQAAHTRTAEAATAAAKAVSDAVTEVAGGAEQWTAVREWAMANADPAEKTAINAMFDAGPLQARAAAKMLVEAYAKAGGTVVTPANPLTKTGAGAGQGAASSTALSPTQYSQEVAALHRQLGTRMDGSPEYKALQQRRAAWRG